MDAVASYNINIGDFRTTALAEQMLGVKSGSFHLSEPSLGLFIVHVYFL